MMNIRTFSPLKIILCASVVLFISLAFIIHLSQPTLQFIEVHDNGLASEHVDQLDPKDFDRSELCTLETFRKYYSKYHRFPTEGDWVLGADSSRFESKICQLTLHDDDPNFLKTCIQATKIRSFMMMGDSNGKRYFRHLHDQAYALAENSMDCMMTKEERTKYDKIPQREFYYGDDPVVNSLLVNTSRLCKSCGGAVHTCSYDWKQPTSIELRTLPLTQLMDASLSLLPAVGYSAPTYQEFLFKYHLKDHFPDVMVIFIPFSHVKQGSNTLDRNKIDVQFFYSTMKHYVPSTTKVFLIGTPSEHDFAKHQAWRGVLFQNMTGTEKIDKLNKILYDVMEQDLLDINSNIYGFFDMVAMSVSRGAWTQGGVHYIDIWYSHVVNYLLEIICNSAKLEH